MTNLKIKTFLSFSLCYLPFPNVGLTTQMPVRQKPVKGAINCGPEHQTDTQERTSLNVWSAQCQGHRRRQHRQKNIHPVSEIKISEPSGNQTRPDGLEVKTLPTTPRRLTTIFHLFITQSYQMIYWKIAVGLAYGRERRSLPFRHRRVVLMQQYNSFHIHRVSQIDVAYTLFETLFFSNKMRKIQKKLEKHCHTFIV